MYWQPLRSSTLISLLATFLVASAATQEQCEVARVKCAYRVGCGMALHSYMVDCGDVMAGRTSKCPMPCKRALISLTSTEEGKTLMDCDCKDSKFCQESKDRIEVCRPEVLKATAEGAVVSCSVAQWICAADHLCSTALDYYHKFCRSMFHGRKCTHRCNNSLAILNRQEKAEKLKTCYCDGTENFQCQTIRDNTDRLCYRKTETKKKESDNKECNEIHPLNSAPNTVVAGNCVLVTALVILSWVISCWTWSEIKR